MCVCTYFAFHVQANIYTVCMVTHTYALYVLSTLVSNYHQQSTKYANVCVLSGLHAYGCMYLRTYNNNIIVLKTVHEIYGQWGMPACCTYY